MVFPVSFGLGSQNLDNNDVIPSREVGLTYTVHAALVSIVKELDLLTPL